MLHLYAYIHVHVGFGGMCYVFDLGNWTKPTGEYIV